MICERPLTKVVLVCAGQLVRSRCAHLVCGRVSSLPRAADPQQFRWWLSWCCMQLFKRAGATASSPATKSVASRPVAPKSSVAAAALPDRSRSVPAADSSSNMGLFDRMKKGGAAAGTSSGKPTTSSVAARAVTVGWQVKQSPCQQSQRPQWTTNITAHAGSL